MNTISTISQRKVKQVDIALDQDELQKISECIEQRWLTEGPKTEAFNNRIREFTGSKYAVFAPNGTLGLFLAILALDLPKGSEIIIPTFTFYASATSAIYAGLKPVFVDVDPETYYMNPEAIEKAVTSNTKAIMPVHIYGQSCDLEPILKVAKKYNLKVIEDAAQGFGVTFEGRHTGTLGDVGMISFFSDKVITMGEGAVLLTQDEDLYQKLKLIRNQGRPSSGVFIHPSLGMNFRVTDIQSAIGLSQISKFEMIKKHRLNLWDVYTEGLKGIGDIKFMSLLSKSNLIPFRVPFTTAKKDELEAYLKENNIETRGFFYPMHLQPCLKKEIPDFLPVSEKLSKEGLCLPVHQHIKEEDANYVIEVIKKFFRGI
jgi:dTDP-4-amino-4,6-dideoxygalactose transaminase